MGALQNGSLEASLEENAEESVRHKIQTRLTDALQDGSLERARPQVAQGARRREARADVLARQARAVRRREEGADRQVPGDERRGPRQAHRDGVGQDQGGREDVRGGGQGPPVDVRGPAEGQGGGDRGGHRVGPRHHEGRQGLRRQEGEGRGYVPQVPQTWAYWDTDYGVQNE